MFQDWAPGHLWPSAVPFLTAFALPAY